MLHRASFGILLTWVLCGWGFTDSLEALEADIKKLTRGQKATYGIAFKHLGTGEVLLLNHEDRMHAASTMKVPVMMRLFAMIDANRLSLDQPVAVVNEFRSIVDGSPYSITVDSEENLYQLIGQEVPLRQLIEAMIIHSSNLATNLLIELAGARETQSLMERLGVDGVKVLRGVEDIKAFEADRNNECSANAMLDIMIACASDSFFTKPSRQAMLAILRQQAYKNNIPAGLPQDEGIRVAHKTGSISRVEHDAAIIDLANGTRYVLIIFARDFKNQRDRVFTTGAAISRRVYEFVAGKP